MLEPSAPRTPAGERAGFSEGAVLGGREGAPLEAELAGIAATGARYLRIDVDWSAIEQQPGDQDWSVVDRIVDQARVCGLDVIGLLAYTPAWARAPGTSEHSPPTDPSTFAEFARAAVERYALRGIKTWEVWNEPNLTFYWAPPPTRPRMPRSSARRTTPSKRSTRRPRSSPAGSRRPSNSPASRR